MITKAELIDLFWRAFWTFVVTFITLFPGTAVIQAISGNNTQLIFRNIWVILAPVIFASLAAVAQVVRTFISNKIGTGTAATRAPLRLGLANPVVTSYTKVNNKEGE